MSSGVQRTITGAFKATGAQLDIRTIGFRPKEVELLNATTNLALRWTDSMADASGVKQIANGTRTFITSAGITPLADGFRLGTDAINTSGNMVHYIARE